MLYLRFKTHLKGIDRKSFFLGDEIIICVCVCETKEIKGAINIGGVGISKILM